MQQNKHSPPRASTSDSEDGRFAHQANFGGFADELLLQLGVRGDREGHIHERLH